MCISQHREAGVHGFLFRALDRFLAISHQMKGSGRIVAQPSVSLASRNVRFWEQMKCPDS